MVIKIHKNMENDAGFKAAFEEAKKGAAEGGVPIGACLVSADGKILGRGHNMRIQKSSATIHVCDMDENTFRDGTRSLSPLSLASISKSA